MKQLYKIFLTLIICVSFCVPGYANSPILLSIEVVNSINRSGITDEYVGTSTSAPCSDLVLFSHSDESIEIDRGTINNTSDDLIDYPGPGYTCLRTDFIFAGKTYSTGNIQLTWDAANNAYTGANPNRVVLDLPG